MITFTSEFSFIQSADTLKGKIANVNATITALEGVMLSVAASDNIQEYRLDDGQTKIQTVYRSVGQVEKSITALEKYRARLTNQLVGSVVQLVDGKNFR